MILVKKHFPDLRKTINEIQKSIVDGGLCIDSNASDNELLAKVMHGVRTNSLGLRKYLIENEDRFQGDYDTLLANFLDFLYGQDLPDMKKKEMIVIIADHLYKSAFVVDKEINAFACLVSLEKAIT